MQDQLRSVVTRLQDAALGRESLSDWTVQAVALVGGDSAVFWAPGAVNPNAAPWFLHRFDEAELHRYFEDYALPGRDPQVAAALAQPCFRPVNLGDALIAPSEFRRSDLYNNLFRSCGWEALASLMTRDFNCADVPRMNLCIASSRRGAFDERTVSVLEALAPHFDSAMMTFAQRRAQSHASLAAAFENAADAIAVLDADGGLRYANATFTALRRAFDASPRRAHEHPIDAPAFKVLREAFDIVRRQAWAAGMSARSCEFDAASIAAGRPRTVRHYVATVSSLQVSLPLPLRQDKAMFLVVIRERQSLQDERIAAVRARYRLTMAETRVLELFTQGLELRTIAERLNVSVHTARAHMKAVLAKTGCRRQAELAQLLDRTLTGQLRVLV